jgi:hypothetical protein
VSRVEAKRVVEDQCAHQLVRLKHETHEGHEGDEGGKEMVLYSFVPLRDLRG